MSVLVHPLVGYFDSPEQTQPAHDPGVDGTDCIVCCKPMQRPVRTICLMWADRAGGLSIFFRACKCCWDGLADDEQAAYEQVVLADLSDNPTGRQA